MATTSKKARDFLDLHYAPELLTVVNVWDVASARAVAGVPETRALATASHAIAATYGYPDGEQIPVDLMLEMCGRIAADTDLPVSADLEAGYGDAGEVVRRAIGLGIVGGNIEDQMQPLKEAVGVVESVMAAAAAEGIDFVLNARTDAFLKAGERDPADVLGDAIQRGRSYMDAGAPVVFVPGILSEEQISALVEALGPQRLTMIGLPGNPSLSRMAELGVGRVSFGPVPQRIALTALQEFAEGVQQGVGVPDGVRPLT